MRRAPEVLKHTYQETQLCLAQQQQGGSCIYASSCMCESTLDYRISIMAEPIRFLIDSLSILRNKSVFIFALCVLYEEKYYGAKQSQWKNFYLRNVIITILVRNESFWSPGSERRIYFYNFQFFHKIALTVDGRTQKIYSSLIKNFSKHNVYQ